MKKVAVFLASAVVGLGGLAVLAPSAQAEPLASVCVTVTPTHVSVGISGIVIGTPPTGVPTTCLVV